MLPIKAIAIFDIGKTNKKLIVFNDSLQLIDQYTRRINEIEDEDGFPCDDLQAIEQFIFEGLDWVLSHTDWILKSVNFSAYGASLVYIDEHGHPLTPLYNYLKPYPQELSNLLMSANGEIENWTVETASPNLGSLNSGLQFYRIQQQLPDIYNRTEFALHLPQYLSYKVCGKFFSDYTSIGCHTGLWDFSRNSYHSWVVLSGLDKKLAPIVSADHTERVNYKGHHFDCGIGIHDSSAALIPYFRKTEDGFALLSTGTWCITLNPQNTEPLTAKELSADCLSYLTYNGRAVKASRLFAGQEHEVQLRHIAAYFKVDPSWLETIPYDETIVQRLDNKAFNKPSTKLGQPLIETLEFRCRGLDKFATPEEAYHQLMLDLVKIQVQSIELVVGENIHTLYIDGGFSRNRIFLELLAKALPDIRLEVSDISQATALGAAMVMQ